MEIAMKLRLLAVLVAGVLAGSLAFAQDAKKDGMKKSGAKAVTVRLAQQNKSKESGTAKLTPEGDKTMRMYNETARIEAGSVSLPRRAPWLEDFRREICAFPGGRHNDQVDAFSQALNRAFQYRRQMISGAVIGLY